MVGFPKFGRVAAAVAVALLCAGPAHAAIDLAEAEVDGVHELLVAEFAVQRGDVGLALSIYAKVVRDTRDPHVARRAVELALRARAFGPALEASAQLLELDPDNTLGREIIASLVANEGLEKGTATIAGLLTRSKSPEALLVQLSHFFSKFPDKAATFEATRTLAAPYAQLPESHYAVGVAALLANRESLAREEAKTALAQRPGWAQAAILEAQVLRKVEPAAVIPYYEKFVEKHPQSREARQQLGRELAGERRLSDAREQFREVEKLAPKDGQTAYAIGLLSLQMEDWKAAANAFSRALENEYRDPGAVYLGMGAAAEGLKRYDDAIGWYRRVQDTDWMRAQLKIASLIAKQNGLAAGREYLQKIEPRSTEDRIQMIQVEAQLLRDAKAWKDTFDLLDRSVREHPESFELLYDRAMAAERIDRLDVAEKDLRQVIKMKPDYAHAYNALGYTLADKTNRLEEAKGLIEQALKLSPDDPFIIDSLGWVHYRLGNFDEAVRNLQQAYSLRPDPEIAAHLGEALWKVGQRDQAAQIWRSALTDNPGHETLLAVIQKYNP